MNVFLTGGTGFIGSYLIPDLLTRDHSVFAHTSRIIDTGDHPFCNPTWVNCSLDNLESLDFSKIDVVVNLMSAGVSPRTCSWEQLAYVNISSSLKLLELAHTAGVRRFVSIGTCLEYGSEAERWHRVPSHAPLKPQTPYASSKAAAFHMMMSYANTTEIEFVHARLFNVYGYGQYKKNLWPSLFEAAKAGIDFKIKNGDHIRDFIHASDVAAHLSYAIERQDVLASKPLVINVGTGCGRKVQDFAKDQWETFGSRGKLVFQEDESDRGSITRVVADISNLY